jgi:hypothetical protein
MDLEASRHELGRRLLAALLSYRYGNIGMDYTLKRYVPEQIDPSWGELAWDLLMAIAHQASARTNLNKLN